MKPETLNFFDRVYDLARQIPFGRVTSYGAIANYLGAKRSARMVGYAMNGSGGKDVPAHRVVNRKGELSGRNQFPTPTLMQELLENEGIEIVNNKIVDFDKHFWHPGHDLNQDDFE